jgi:2-hydroxy-6-oxonona-2,4-dienedioate hydrolase
MPAFTYEATSKTFAADHGDIHYHEAGSGPDLLLLHGSGPGVTGWANFEGNLPVFAEHFHCVIIDLPGYGKSDPIEGDPIAGCVSAALALMHGLAMDRTHIIGNSLGGIVGSHIAANHPGRVDRFVTIGGIGVNIFSPFPGEGLNLLTEFTEDPSRERLEQWLRSMVFDQSLVTGEMIESRFKQATEPVTMATSRKIYARASIAALAEVFRGEHTLQRVAHLAKIEAPTLITWGRDDRVTPLDIALLPMRIMPNAELHVFPNCGHWNMIERKLEFESVVKAFLMR